MHGPAFQPCVHFNTALIYLPYTSAAWASISSSTPGLAGGVRDRVRLLTTPRLKQNEKMTAETKGLEPQRSQSPQGCARKFSEYTLICLSLNKFLQTFHRRSTLGIPSPLEILCVLRVLCGESIHGARRLPWPTVNRQGLRWRANPCHRGTASGSITPAPWRA